MENNQQIEEQYLERPFFDNLAVVGYDIIAGFFINRPNFPRRNASPELISEVFRNSILPTVIINLA